jgi:hypothetical protein
VSGVAGSWRRCSARLVASAALLPLGLGAQASLRVDVTDGLRGTSPFSGALVVLTPTNRTARADSAGRVTFDGLAPGQYRVTLRDPLLASIGWTEVGTNVSLGTADVSTRLQTPRIEDLQRAFCGSALGPESGLIMGDAVFATGEPVASGAVAAIWREGVLTAREMRNEMRASVDTATAVGRFTLCGVPIGAQVQVLGGTPEMGTEILELYVGERGVLHTILMFGAPTRALTLTGRVVDERGAPVAGAAVSILAEPNNAARTDTAGHFVLPSVSPRTTQLRVRRLGHQVQTISAAFDAPTQLADIVLPRLPQSLAEVRVNAFEVRTLDHLAFLERMRKGRGTFLTDSTLARMGTITANKLVMTRTGVALSTEPGVKRLQMRRSAHFNEPCDPEFYVDGRQFGVLSPWEQEQVLQSAKRMEIYSNDEMPTEYFGMNTCGVILVWTI